MIDSDDPTTHAEAILHDPDEMTRSAQAQQPALDERHKTLIAEAVDRHGIVVGEDEWEIDEDGHTRANLGRWFVINEDDDRGLFADDEGALHVSVVGARQHNNEHVAYYFTSDDHESGVEVEPFEDIEPL